MVVVAAMEWQPPCSAMVAQAVLDYLYDDFVRTGAAFYRDWHELSSFLFWCLFSLRHEALHFVLAD